MASDPRIFLIVSAQPERRQLFWDLIISQSPTATIYHAIDGASGLAKIRNRPPNIVIMDWDLPSVPGPKFVAEVMDEPAWKHVALIVASHPPEEELYLDEIVTGRIQFLDSRLTEEKFAHGMAKALNFAFDGRHVEYQLRFLASDDPLLKEGDTAEAVYIVKSGKLKAFHVVDGKEVVLGEIEAGEFVGEMAYINGEPRSANVTAVSNCELIEVPFGTFEAVLFRRPAWSKSLMKTLSRRLKKANEQKVPEPSSE